ncbi:ABC transporter permease [Modestobacter sp. SYSU DS0511]
MTARPSLAGTGALLRFALRRDRLRLPAWVAGGALLVIVQSAAAQSTYDSPGSLAAYRASVGSNAASIALAGPPVGLDTIAGTVAFEMATPLAVVAVLMVMFTTVRHTRADEELGRTELVRSTRIGRHAPLAAAAGVAALASAALGAAIGAGATASGLPAPGAFVLGASATATGLAFTGLTALAAQLVSTARGVYGLVGALLGVSLVLRAIGDVEGNGLSWASPVGWAQASHPWSGDRWWPLLLSVAAGVAALAAATQVLDRRDLGAGLVHPRPAAAVAPRSLLSPLGLTWRLHRGALLGWAVGVTLLGAVYGALAESVETLLADNPDVTAFLPDASAAGLVDAFLGVALTTTALLVAAYGVAAALRARAEETAGRAEPLLATATSRSRWLGGHVLVALAGTVVLLALGGLGTGAARAASTGDAGDLVRVLGAALAHTAGVWVLVAVAVALVGLAPEPALPAAWAAFGLVAVVTLFAESFDWPGWVTDLSPLAWTPAMPAEPWSTAPVAGLLAVTAALTVIGLGAFRRRDLATA